LNAADDPRHHILCRPNGSVFFKFAQNTAMRRTNRFPVSSNPVAVPMIETTQPNGRTTREGNSTEGSKRQLINAHVQGRRTVSTLPTCV
jgi:hypothetical protein